MTRPGCALRRTAFIAGLLALSACAAPPGDDIPDPFEPANRVVHQANRLTDRVVMRPFAAVYGALAPTPFTGASLNVTQNLGLPVVAVNHLLQGEGELAIHSVLRFGANTIFGLGGMLDPAREMGLPHRPTDFGLTLRRWGLPEGVYTEAPLRGPGMTIDHVGAYASAALFGPLAASEWLLTTPAQTRFASTASQAARVAARHLSGPLIDEVLYESADSYVALRGMVVSHRRYLASKTNVVEPGFDPLQDPFAPDVGPGETP